MYNYICTHTLFIGVSARVVYLSVVYLFFFNGPELSLSPVLFNVCHCWETVGILAQTHL